METARINVPGSASPPEEPLRQLDIFEGKWNVEVEKLKGARSGQEEIVRGIETYDWLSGGHFMVNRWSRKVGMDVHIGIGVVGFDPSTGYFTANHFDNRGAARSYNVTVSRLTWKYMGTQERARIDFTPDGRTFVAFWEGSDDGIKWEPLYRLKGNKI
jgi:hypothetical protein